MKASEAGYTDTEIAELLGVCESTINAWKREHEEFAHALKNGKEVADERVERSLYYRACGYSFDAVKVFQYQGEIIKAEYREHVPPDVTACIFWLKNSRPDAWRDKRETAHSVDVTLGQLVLNSFEHDET